MIDGTNGIESQECETVEFKSSAFIDPELRRPGLKQMRTIAKTIAAFMNSAGGSLYIGVKDDGRPCGLEGDFMLLSTQASWIVLSTPRASDAGYSYGGNADGYERKIRQILRSLLSANASKYIKAIEFVVCESKQVCRVDVAPCDMGDAVYYYHWTGHGEVEQIYVRDGNGKRRLEGKARDDYVRERCVAQLDRLIDRVLSRLPRKQQLDMGSALGRQEVSEEQDHADEREARSLDEQNLSVGRYRQASLFRIVYNMELGRPEIYTDVENGGTPMRVGHSPKQGMLKLV